MQEVWEGGYFSWVYCHVEQIRVLKINRKERKILVECTVKYATASNMGRDQGLKRMGSKRGKSQGLSRTKSLVLGYSLQIKTIASTQSLGLNGTNQLQKEKKNTT